MRWLINTDELLQFANEEAQAEIDDAFSSEVDVQRARRALRTIRRLEEQRVVDMSFAQALRWAEAIARVSASLAEHQEARLMRDVRPARA